MRMNESGPDGDDDEGKERSDSYTPSLTMRTVRKKSESAKIQGEICFSRSTHKRL